MKVLDFILYYLWVLETSFIKYVCTLLLDERMSWVAHFIQFALLDNKSAIVDVEEWNCEVENVRA